MNNELIGKYLAAITNKFWNIKIISHDGEKYNYMFHGYFKDDDEKLSSEYVEFGKNCENLEQLLYKVCKDNNILPA